MGCIWYCFHAAIYERNVKRWWSVETLMILTHRYDNLIANFAPVLMLWCAVYWIQVRIFSCLFFFSVQNGIKKPWNLTFSLYCFEYRFILFRPSFEETKDDIAGLSDIKFTFVIVPDGHLFKIIFCLVDWRTYTQTRALEILLGKRSVKYKAWASCSKFWWTDGQKFELV